MNFALCATLKIHALLYIVVTEHERMTGLSLIFLLSFVFWLKLELRSQLDTCARFRSLLLNLRLGDIRKRSVCFAFSRLRCGLYGSILDEIKQHCSWGLLREIVARFPGDVAPGERK